MKLELSVLLAFGILRSAVTLIVIDDIPLEYVIVNGSVPENIFNGYANGSSITIRDIQLERLPPKLLQNLLNLVEFTLEETQIKQIPTGFFANNKKLLTVKVISNKLRSVPKIRSESLTALVLHSNKICEFGNSHILIDLPNLQYLNLSSNYLRAIKYPLIAPKLCYLDLTFNRINRLHKDSFIEMETLESLKLSNNGLSKLPSTDMFVNNKALKNIWLGNNAYYCDCNNEEFLRSAVVLDTYPMQLVDKAHILCLYEPTYSYEKLHVRCVDQIRQFSRHQFTAPETSETLIRLNITDLLLIVVGSIVFIIILRCLCSSLKYSDAHPGACRTTHVKYNAI